MDSPLGSVLANIFMKKVVSIYRKKTLTDLHTKWDSWTPWKYKINLIQSLTCHYYRLYSFCSLLQSALDNLQNGYPQGIINYQINDVLNRNRHLQHNNNPRRSAVPKKDIIILLPYLIRSICKATKSPNTWNYVRTNFILVLSSRSFFQSTRCVKSLFPCIVRATLIVHNNPELFAEQIAGIVMVFALVKVNRVSR